MSNHTQSLSAIIALIGLWGGISAASAQDENPFLGKWTATWDNKDGRPLQADVLITDTGGTWQTLVKRKLDPCVGKEAPIEIKSVSPKEMRFTARYSEVLTGCKDTHIKLNLQADGNVVGSRGQDEMKFNRN